MRAKNRLNYTDTYESQKIMYRYQANFPKIFY